MNQGLSWRQEMKKSALILVLLVVAVAAGVAWTPPCTWDLACGPFIGNVYYYLYTCNYPGCSGEPNLPHVCQTWKCKRFDCGSYEVLSHYDYWITCVDDC